MKKLFLTLALLTSLTSHADIGVPFSDCDKDTAIGYTNYIDDCNVFSYHIEK
jgi:hypothetical protein